MYFCFLVSIVFLNDILDFQIELVVAKLVGLAGLVCSSKLLIFVTGWADLNHFLSKNLNLYKYLVCQI